MSIIFINIFTSIPDYISKAVETNSNNSITVHNGQTVTDPISTLDALVTVKPSLFLVDLISRTVAGLSLLIPTKPADVIRILSVTPAAPSAAVENVSLPGISLLPGVPSTEQLIVPAYDVTSVPSAPQKTSSPSESPDWTTVTPPWDPLDFEKITAPPPALSASLRMAIDEFG